MLKIFFPLVGCLVLSSCVSTMPVSATSNTVGSKIGKSGGWCFIGICPNVDASIYTAAKNANITKVSTVDLRTTNYLWVVKKYECLVSGE